jgi:Tfp pilus assembly protein PilX
MTHARDQRGSALVIAITVMAIILGTSLATMAFIDRSQARSGSERVKETSFNLGEALLNEDVLVLAAQWPSAAAKAVPANCTAAGLGCPDPAQALASFPAAYTSSGIAWNLSVRDNLGAATTYYSKSVTDATPCAGVTPCSWDSNGDGAVWVRADFTVRGRTRSLVAMVRQQQSRITLPRNTITAGYFRTTNKGLKVIVDEKGCQAKSKPSATCNTTEPAPVVVRCSSATAGTPSDACLGFRSLQVSPTATTQSYPSNALTPAMLTQMKTAAVQGGTYFNASRGCPTTAQATGKIVFVDGLSCSFTGGTINSAAAPGTLVVNQGTVSLGGNTSFYGVMYAANNLTPPADAGTLINLSGTAYVQGALYVEGNGGVSAGASGVNISFDPNVLSDILVASTPIVAQNSFRELPLGQ